MNIHLEASSETVTANSSYLLTSPPLADRPTAPPLFDHVFDHLYIQHPSRWVMVLLLAYLGIGSLFALLTPAWQAPDEPAHYNYIAHIATEGTLPVLQWGDYDQGYLARLLKKRFPRRLSIAPLRYESYQPPLYYLSAAPLFWLSNGNLFMMRLYNVLLGAASILIFYRCLRVVFPHKHLLTVGATAFAALLPMHVAMSAAVNNDGLAELLVLASLLALIHWMQGLVCAANPATVSDTRVRQLLLLGLLLGLGLLTKIYSYLLLPLYILVVGLVSWRKPVMGRQKIDALGNMFLVAIPALVLGLPLWIRNARVYGILDPLGLSFHDRIVVGQATTAEWIAQHGRMFLVERAVDFTFKSFWGVFGWLGVFMDSRIYTALLIFTGILILGLLWGLVRLVSGAPDIDANSFQRWVMLFFLLFIAVVTFGYIGYNLKFVQHQGRYFFWGLLPISTFVAIAWREVMRPVQGVITGSLLIVLAAALAVTGALSIPIGNDGVDKWMLLTIGLFAIFLLLQPLLLIDTTTRSISWMPARLMRILAAPIIVSTSGLLRAVAWATPFILLAFLALASLFIFIIPQLRP